MPDFLYVIKPQRSSFLHDATDAEMEIVGRHFAYLQAALAEGKLVLAGRTAQAEFGIAVFHAESEGEAQAFMNDDPAVAAGVFSAILYPFHIALSNARE